MSFAWPLALLSLLVVPLLLGVVVLIATTVSLPFTARIRRGNAST